jgi:hypothetical protein
VKVKLTELLEEEKEKAETIRAKKFDQLSKEF